MNKHKNKQGLETLLIILYHTLVEYEEVAENPKPGRPEKHNNAEIVCLSVAQALENITNKRAFIRKAPLLLGNLFKEYPDRSIYHRRLKQCEELLYYAWQFILSLMDCDYDDLGIVDSTSIVLCVNYASARNNSHRETASPARKKPYNSAFYGSRLHFIINLRECLKVLLLVQPRQLRMSVLHCTVC